MIREKKSFMHKLLIRLIRYKTYIDRARAYTGYISFTMMILVMLKVYSDTTWGMWLFAHKLVLGLLVVLMFGIFIIVGYVDRKHIKPLEIIELTKADPLFMLMREKINDIHDKFCK